MLSPAESPTGSNDLKPCYMTRTAVLFWPANLQDVIIIVAHVAGAAAATVTALVVSSERRGGEGGTPWARCREIGEETGSSRTRIGDGQATG